MEQKEIKALRLSNDPHIHTRSVLFTDEQEDIKKKNKKQFITCTPASLDVLFTDDTYIHLDAPKGYIFDGATIPFNIGKGDMRLLIPALFHDIMCDDKSTINYDRNLASRIFWKALLQCHIPPAKAKMMYMAVELFQKTCCNWRKPTDG